MGGLEDEDGNLLVLDHPTINLYYEFSLKRAIMENLYLNGESDIERRLKYVTDRLDEYRQQALSIANTADFRQCIDTATTLRNMANRRYAWPISRWKGYLGFVDPIDRI
jgi:hypothetical protein